MPTHEDIVSLHENKFDNLEKRVSVLELDVKGQADRAQVLASAIQRHDETMGELKALRWWLMGTIVTIIGAVMIWLVSWGAITRQIEINTQRLGYIEALHPRASVIGTIVEK